jgi:hypothetical protein
MLATPTACAKRLSFSFQTERVIMIHDPPLTTLTIFLGNGVTYNDPTAADPDPTITLFGSASVFTSASYGQAPTLTTITIHGLNATDTLSFSGGAYAGFTLLPGAGGTTYVLSYTGSFGQNTASAWTGALRAIQFTSTNDPAQNTVQTLSLTYTGGPFGISQVGTETLTTTVCYLRGTNILTPAGERAVESLEIGDLVTTHDGAQKPIRWIGRQTVSIRFADPLRVLPVRIRVGAIGDNVPCRDLLVSPGHALLVDDVLI